jgi:hypothetical protein
LSDEGTKVVDRAAGRENDGVGAPALEDVLEVSNDVPGRCPRFVRGDDIDATARCTKSVGKGVSGLCCARQEDTHLFGQRGISRRGRRHRTKDLVGEPFPAKFLCRNVGAQAVALGWPWRSRARAVAGPIAASREVPNALASAPALTSASHVCSTPLALVKATQA